MRDELRARWYLVMNKGAELNRVCPWIYSDKWFKLFINEMMDAFNHDSDKDLDILLGDWEKDFRMS